MSSSLLSELVFLRTYSAVKEDGTKESWEECVERNKNMHLEKFPFLKQDIMFLKSYELVKEKKVLPSMRSMQFGGPAIANTNERNFNCSFVGLDSFQSFAEICYLSMCGVGVGFSVTQEFLEKLPVITESKDEELFVIPDNKEGWADSIKLLLSNPSISFDYSLLRPNGAKLASGGTASGPEVLQQGHEKIRKILKGALGTRLSSLQAHDIACHIGDFVVAGGVRRTALISLFNWWDIDMLKAKQGEWWIENPQRARANNSAHILRKDPQAKYAFEKVMKACFESKAGEPGVAWTNSYAVGGNPCFEISLQHMGFCNLTEVALANCADIEEVMDAVIAATIIGTVQASYTQFNYLRPQWKKNAEDEALLGVSLTGLAQVKLTGKQLQRMAAMAKSINARMSAKIGINPSKRITTVKPSGSASSVLGTSSGIHAAFSDFYVRRVRIEQIHPLTTKLKELIPSLVEVDLFNPSIAIVSIPVSMKNAVVKKNETAVQFLDRIKHVFDNWIVPGHLEGVNTHNVSATVNYKDGEEQGITEWMWLNRYHYNGISLLPDDGGVYVQAPYEEIDETAYKAMKSLIPESIDFSSISWHAVADERVTTAACEGGLCELPSPI